MLTENQKNIIFDTLKPFHPIRIGVFGSVSRGEDNGKSDIDIMYALNKPIGLFTLMDIVENLETKLKRKVDLVSEKYTNPLFKPFILNDLTINL